MAVGVIMDFDGATLEQYDAVIERLGLEPRGSAPDGGLFHWVTETPSGIRVTDVWESQERFDEYGSTQIGPATAAVGVPGPPRVQILPVHNHMAGSGEASSPVAVVVEFDDATLEQYDAAIATAGLAPGGPGADGCLFHWVTAIATGIRVTDVWSDRGRFEDYARSHIMPSVAAAGLSSAPRIEFMPVHNHISSGKAVAGVG